MASLVYVDIRQSSTRWPWKRPQRWFWVALSGDNRRVLGQSSEKYTNRLDCVNAARILFGTSSNVYRREPETGNVTLRLSTEDRGA